MDVKIIESINLTAVTLILNHHIQLMNHRCILLQHCLGDHGTLQKIVLYDDNIWKRMYHNYDFDNI